MPFTAGARLGPCEVLGLIGAVGLDEIYRRRDTRLDRALAISRARGKQARQLARQHSLSRTGGKYGSNCSGRSYHWE
jgi:hypothetical protein